jgi:hypothetical protein
MTSYLAGLPDVSRLGAQPRLIEHAARHANSNRRRAIRGLSFVGGDVAAEGNPGEQKDHFREPAGFTTILVRSANVKKAVRIGNAPADRK